MTEQTDGALAGLSSRGDKLAFETLMRRYLPLLGGYAACRAPSNADAEDAIQETMLAAWRSIAAYDGASTVKTWLIAILRRKLADIYRFRYRSDNIWLDDAGDIPEEENPDTGAAERCDLTAAMKRLTGAEKELVYLIFNAGLGYAEAAHVLDIPEGTIKSRMSAVRNKLRKTIGEGYL